MDISGYAYETVGFSHTHAYLSPTVDQILDRVKAKRLFEIGCGNGSTAAYYSSKGIDVTGVDPSEQGIEIANQKHSLLKLSAGSTDDDLVGKFGQFPAVVSLEVVEHVFLPRPFAKKLFDLVEPGGVAVLSTPYHGYLKNLALALTGKMDQHFTVLWDYGHIKFWSIKTLGQLLTEAGFVNLKFHRVGRVPALAMSMIVEAYKPR